VTARRVASAAACAALVLATFVQDSVVPAPPFFGMAVPRADAAELRRVGAIVGCQPAVVSAFVKLDSPSFTLGRLRELGRAGQVPFLTVEPWSYRSLGESTRQPRYTLASIVAGEHDPELTRIAGTVAAFGEPVLLRFAHEMNGWWYPWAAGQNGGDAAQYVAAWRHVHALFRRAGAGNAEWVWSPASTGRMPLAPLYPGDDVVTYVGLTGYGRGRSAAETFGPSLAEIRMFTGRPVVLSEVGADGPHKTAWIRSLGPYLRADRRIAGFVWFNTSASTTGATGDYRVDDSPAAATALRGVLDTLGTRCRTASAELR
jgi:hypothetical protein